MKHLLTAALLLAALALYVAGLNGAGLGALLAGGALELWFWVRVVRSTRKPEARSVDA